MIRRPLVVCGAVALAVSLTSGCATFSNNKAAASVNDHELSVEDFEGVANDVAGPDDSNEIPGDVARDILTVWVQGQLITDSLAANGQEVTQEDRDAAELQLTEAYADDWNGFSESTRTFLIDSVAADQALVTDEAVQALYDQGVTTSNVACLRFILAPDQATADEIAAELASGAPFAEVADAHVPEGADPAANPPGGIVLNPETGSECFPADLLTPELIDSLAATPIGEATGALPLQDQFAFFLQRPFDEVIDPASALMAPTISPDARDVIVIDAEARVDSRYGMWDGATGEVVATR